MLSSLIGANILLIFSSLASNRGERDQPAGDSHHVIGAVECHFIEN